ncbi:MAG: NnrS family protein, partial [Paracoccaceae bacterium]
MPKPYNSSSLKPTPDAPSSSEPSSYAPSSFAPALLQLGFRPFFFLGALYSLISLLIWGGFYAGQITPPAFLIDPISWHIHEMLYGFTLAIIAGFLLTAVVNWTGSAPIRQRHLVALCLLWLAGRIVINIDLGLPFWAILVIETSFIPVLLVSLAIPLIRANNRRNFLILLRLLVLFACDIWFLKTGSKVPLYIALMMVLTMISLIGGRVIPAFTINALRRTGIQATQTPQPIVDKAAVA